MASASPLILLTFDWAVGPVDPNPAPVDFLYARLRRADGSLITTAYTLTNRSTPAGAWQTASVDMSGALQPYLGQTVELSFESQTNANGPTTFYLDNVFLDTDLPPGAAPLRDKIVYLPLVQKSAKAGAMTGAVQPRQPRPGLDLPVRSLSPMAGQDEPGSVLRYHLEQR